MRTQLTITLAGAALAAFILAVPAVAHEHSELNGTWTVVPAKSEFAGQPVIQTGTVTIRDRDGITIIERNFAYEGAGETYFYRDSIGNEHGGTIHSGKDLKTKTKWDHDILRVTTTLAGGVTVESYALAPDGTMRVNVESPGHKPITLVMERK